VQPDAKNKSIIEALYFNLKSKPSFGSIRPFRPFHRIREMMSNPHFMPQQENSDPFSSNKAWTRGMIEPNSD
jgi:hypothetical protein